MATTSSFSLLLDAERCELEAMLDSKIAGLGRGQKQDYVRRLALFGAAFENFDPDTFNMVTGLALKTTDPGRVVQTALALFTAQGKLKQPEKPQQAAAVPQPVEAEVAPEPEPEPASIHDYSQMD